LFEDVDSENDRINIRLPFSENSDICKIYHLLLSFLNGFHFYSLAVTNNIQNFINWAKEKRSPVKFKLNPPLSAHNIGIVLIFCSRRLQSTKWQIGVYIMTLSFHKRKKHDLDVEFSTMKITDII